ncbi:MULTISPECIES: glycosyltransferase family protein [Bradyrhizobium]|uniref:glycosytransferase n=1 Tax=Bradyrhizobium elkanii TaxID=29448 RepID=UPI000427C406|nr:glycosytransferase [Bradyrhizobium elkanii]
MKSRPLRAMWLLNHTTARKFEVPMLKRVGIEEIFLPKKIPSDPSFRSGSVDWSEDENLTIPKQDLAILNATDWYDEPSADAWRIANEHFQLIFFILLNADFFRSIMRNFCGAKVWRAYGLSDPPLSYARILSHYGWRKGPSWSAHAAASLWFGQAYSHLAEVEPRWLADRAIYLPAGLESADLRDDWIGSDRRIFFVCPDLAFNDYYQDVYRDFKRTFAGLAYVVAGAQPLRVEDEHVLGYVSGEQYRLNMRSFAVMYYHSSERYHVHYHPFEAVRAGMPLVFMGGGLLDRLGGLKLPGRCKTPQEARSKIERILAGDKQLIGQIRESQAVLLDSMKAEHCEPIWRSGIELILKRTAEARSTAPIVRKKRVAVILPVAYRGGSLRGAKLLAHAVAIGSQHFGSPVDVVFGHLDDPTSYPDREFDDLPDHIERRAFHWRTLPQGQAIRACAYAGVEGPLLPTTYAVPDDGINQFLDCDLWIFISDRLQFPILPVRPYVLMIYDYLQRYVPIMDENARQRVIDRAHAAEAVLVTTDFTANDARQFAGLPAKKVRKVPLLVPAFGGKGGSAQGGPPASKYFIWTTNLALHKNHRNALEALRIYYEEYGGLFECHVTGVDTDKLFTHKLTHLVAAREIHNASKALKVSLRTEGDLPDPVYRRKLRDAAFLWHPGLIDNGTFSVVEAASFGVPALSSDYPTMREIDRQFELDLTWSDPNDPVDMASKLKRMETAQRSTPRPEVFARHSLEQSAAEYWQVIQEYL